MATEQCSSLLEGHHVNRSSEFNCAYLDLDLDLATLPLFCSHNLDRFFVWFSHLHALLVINPFLMTPVLTVQKEINLQRQGRATGETGSCT